LGFCVAAIVARDRHTDASFYATFSCACGGNEYITEEWHYWRVYQRNVPEYGGGSE